MSRTYAVFFLAVCFLLMPLKSESSAETEVFFSSVSLVRGDLILITIKADILEKPQIIWRKKEIPLIYSQANASWRGFIAADLKQKPGVYKVVVQLPSSGFEKEFYIRVNDRDYGVRKLNLDPKKVELDAEALNRVKNEAAIVNKLWTADCQLPLWDDRFLMPVDKKIVGTFGRRSIINKRKRAPHTGVDISGKLGDPVKAIHNGTVMLVADHFFTGNSLYLDHGGCIISMYFHLDKILVKDGDQIEKGQIIGLVGATGRVTGPHLHWGVRINGARVNPLTLIELSRELDG
ncbi:MAG: M23 family metallopeptidase [Smithellaceae bacterium]|jgi:murein DD-endopeptidase MepM/ murein hydrolase activator NlpD|nr:M23 family metallopeptidase [Smithellaceae bacterium]MDD5413636.1 M23 family metallopeptidase [Smithellaceae bacterium]HBJ75423.1 peptidase M23 [Syntrophaceae bacterium]HCS77309.1 peptidase M23 [Syntrophaceae bacterium]HCX02260.1 peptidase M23 [Syntrophaceae bacterium]